MPYWLQNFLAGISFNGLVSFGAVLVGLFGAITAAKGINAWRTEMTGRRRAELAEETLARFYEARDHLAWTRHPWGFPGEGKTRERRPGESEQESADRDAYYRAIERIEKRAEFWGVFDASRYRFRAVFGPAAAEPFEIVLKKRHEVIVCVGSLIRNDRAYRFVSDPKVAEHNEKLVAKWESMIGWGTSDEDEVAAAIEAAVASMERTCQPAIDGFYDRRKPGWLLLFTTAGAPRRN